MKNQHGRKSNKSTDFDPDATLTKKQRQQQQMMMKVDYVFDDL